MADCWVSSGSYPRAWTRIVRRASRLRPKPLGRNGEGTTRQSGFRSSSRTHTTAASQSAASGCG